jgi:hypothetical protein
MATWVKVSQDQKIEDQCTGTQSDDGKITWTLIQTWNAQTDGTSRATTYEAAFASDGTNTIPALGSDIIIDSTEFTVNQSRPKRSGPNSFNIQITSVYTYTPPQSSNKWNVQVNFAGQPFSQTAYKDKDSKAIVNSAGQPFDPSVEHTYYDEKISISYNTTLEQSSSFASIRGMVNSSAVTLSLPGITRSFSARQVYCVDASQSADVNLTDGTATFKVSIELNVRQDTYIDNILDQGFYYLDTSTNEIVQIKDKYGDLLSAPARLDGNGGVLAPGGTPVYLPFKIESEADFTSAFEGLGG